MPTYLRVRWAHDEPDDPILYHYELDDRRFELRRVEEFRDGRLLPASEELSPDELGLLPVPPVEELDPEFHPTVIEREEFETVWARATRSG